MMLLGQLLFSVEAGPPLPRETASYEGKVTCPVIDIVFVDESVFIVAGGLVRNL